MSISIAGLYGARSLREYLSGTWHLRRTITARDGTVLGRVRDAVASFVPMPRRSSPPDAGDDACDDDGARLLYRESGSVDLVAASSPLEFEREYVYAFTGPTSADVAFRVIARSRGRLVRSRSDAVEEAAAGDGDSDGGHFHSLSVSAKTGVGETTEHLCIADLYRASIEIAERDAFTWRWSVVGPAKDYTIESIFERAGTEEEVVDVVAGGGDAAAAAPR